MLFRSVDIHGSDVVVVMLLGRGSLLGLVLDLATAEEGLRVGSLVEDDTEASGHVGDVAIRVVIHGHSRVLASITVHILKRVGLIGLRFVDLGMVLRLNCGSSLPWLDGKELLTLLDLFSLKLKEVRLPRSKLLYANMFVIF